MKNIFTLSVFLIAVLYSSAQFSLSNKAVHFSNTNNSVNDEGINIPSNSLMDFTATQSFTIEAWIKPTQATGCGMIFVEEYCPGPSTGVRLNLFGGKVNFSINDNTFHNQVLASNCTITDGNWHHVAAVRNVVTDSLYIYIDGVENGRMLDITVTTLTDLNALYFAGRYLCGGLVCNFYGDVDELRIWHKSKTQAEIIAQKDIELTGNEAALKLYYNFNTAVNGNGQTVINNCSNTGVALNGTNLGTATEPSFNNAQPQGTFVPCDPVLWLKADAGVYTDAGVTLATNGQTVQQWNDQSGNNKNATQLTATNKPTLVSNALNGKPLLRFSTASGFNQLVVPAIDLSAVNKTDLFIVYKINSGNVFFENTADLNANTTGFAMYDNPQAGSGASVTLRGDVGYNTIYSHKDCDKYILSEGTLDKSLSTSEANVRVNGVLNPPPATQPFNSNNSNNFGNNVSYIGYRGAGAVNGALPMSGDIAEIILFNRVLTAEERTNIENYLINKYDLNNPGTAVCGPVLWLKADAGVYTDAGITAASDGQNVQQWNDQSGNGNHVTQTTAINKPVFKSPDATAKPALYFDGVAGKMFLNNTTSNLVTGGSARTVFVATRRDCNTHAGGGVGGTLFTFRRNGLINTLAYGANSYGTPVYIYSDNNGVGNNNATIASSTIDTAVSPIIVTYKIPAAGSQIQCNLNGIAQTVNQGAGAVNTETGTTGFTVGDREDQPDLDWSGWIYEVIVYNRTLTGTEIIQVENYLKNKYTTGSSAPFTALPAAQTSSNSLQDDGLWKHSYNSSDNLKVIASVKDYCLNLGTRNDVVYTDATAGLYNGQRYMRRHYVIKPTLNPAGTKRVRLYYTNADFADLQTYIPSLTSASQLVITKYSGTNEDGVYDPSGGTVTFIPSSQIITGALYGSNYLEFDVTGFSEFWIHTGLSPLPLQFINFLATKRDNSVELNWKTENEINVDHFELERSIDGIQFKVFTAVPAKNQTQNNYSATDALTGLPVNRPTLFYRIKQIDNNGQFKYSVIAKISFGKKLDVIIAPNPAKDIVTIITSVNVKQLQLINVNGQVIKSWIPAANQQYNVADIAAGVYYLRLINDAIMQTEKIIIRK